MIGASLQSLLGGDEKGSAGGGQRFVGGRRQWVFLVGFRELTSSRKKGPNPQAQNNDATRLYFLGFDAASAAASTARREYRARGSRSAALAIRLASSAERRNVITRSRAAFGADLAVFRAGWAFFLWTFFLAVLDIFTSPWIAAGPSRGHDIHGSIGPGNPLENAFLPGFSEGQDSAGFVHAGGTLRLDDGPTKRHHEGHGPWTNAPDQRDPAQSHSGGHRGDPEPGWSATLDPHGKALGE